jgi:hypothetical protein
LSSNPSRVSKGVPFLIFERLTSFKKFIPQDGVHRHLSVDAHDASPDPFIVRIPLVDLVDASVDGIKVGMNFFETTTGGKVFTQSVSSFSRYKHFFQFTWEVESVTKNGGDHTPAFSIIDITKKRIRHNERIR